MTRSIVLYSGLSQNCKFIVLSHGKSMHKKRKPQIRQRIKRHTYSTIAGIEDLTAVLIDLTFRIERIIAFSKTIAKEASEVEGRLNTAKTIARIIRASPHSYPVDGHYKITRTQVQHETQTQERRNERTHLQASQD